jgi:hypothetical protein
MCVGNALSLEKERNKVAGGLGDGRKGRSFSYEFKSTKFKATALFDFTELRALDISQEVFWVPHGTYKVSLLLQKRVKN